MKMKSLFLLFCVTGVLLSCRQTKKGPDFTFREDVAYILDTIIASNPKGDVYELYINTVDSGNSILLFYMGEKAPLFPLEYGQTPSLLQVRISHAVVDIYSGVEKYLFQQSLRKVETVQRGEEESGRNGWIIEDMTAGRGFIAIAAASLGGNKPVPTLLVCLLFGDRKSVV